MRTANASRSPASTLVMICWSASEGSRLCPGTVVVTVQSITPGPPRSTALAGPGPSWCGFAGRDDEARAT
jgi:hypothetical protein